MTGKGELWHKKEEKKQMCDILATILDLAAVMEFKGDSGEI